MIRVAGVALLLGCSPSSEQVANGTSDHARGACETFVRQRLQAPATARFTAVGRPVMIDPGHWRARGAFDAENGVKTTMRGTFVCEVQHAPGNNYSLLALTLR